jgi:predicted DNA-binding protein with PD1-like motif
MHKYFIAPMSIHTHSFSCVGLVMDVAISAWNHASVRWNVWRSLAPPPHNVQIRSLVSGNAGELNSLHVHTQLAVVRWRLMSCRFALECIDRLV